MHLFIQILFIDFIFERIVNNSAQLNLMTPTFFTFIEAFFTVNKEGYTQSASRILH